MVRKTFCLCFVWAMATSFTPSTIPRTKHSRRGVAATNVLAQRMTIADDDFARIFGKREALERTQAHADQFIDAHSDEDKKQQNVAFVGPSKKATNTTKGKYTRQSG